MFFITELDCSRVHTSDTIIKFYDAGNIADNSCRRRANCQTSGYGLAIMLPAMKISKLIFNLTEPTFEFCCNINSLQSCHHQVLLNPPLLDTIPT